MDVIKNDEGTNVGANIRRIRLESDIGQTDLVRILQLMGDSSLTHTGYKSGMDLMLPAW